MRTYVIKRRNEEVGVIRGCQ